MSIIPEYPHWLGYIKARDENTIATRETALAGVAPVSRLTDLKDVRKTSYQTYRLE